MSYHLPSPVRTATPEEDISSPYDRKPIPWFAFLLWFSALLAVTVAQSAEAQTNFIGKGAGVVSYVTDGDTMEIIPDDKAIWSELREAAEEAKRRYQRPGNLADIFDVQRKSFRTRIGNINTAESVHPDDWRNTKAGKKASDVARDLVSNKRVAFACWEIGYYLRPICSVWTDEFEFGMTMIRNGYSTYVTKYGDHPFWHAEYEDAQALAKAR